MPTKRGKRWVAQGYEAATKRKRHLGTCATRREAVALEAQWRLAAKNTSRETCDHFAGRWLTDYPRPRLSTMRTHREHTRRFARDFKGVRLGDVDRPTARAWAIKHPGDLAAVRAMFGDALRDGLVQINPFSNLRIARSRGRKDLVALTQTQLHALADWALSERMELGEYGREYRAMVLFAGYTGVRPGELFALRGDDVRNDELHVERAYDSHSHQTTPPKNGRSRIVPIAPPAQDALLDVPRHPNGLLFVTPTDKQWTQSLHHRYWTRLRLLANHPSMSFYELRHAAATMLLERGNTPWDAAIQLGHTDGGGLIMDVYGHPSEPAARARILASWGARPITPLRIADHQREAS